MVPTVSLKYPGNFGKYQLLEHLGGGMSDVYRAQDTVIGKVVAIKILRQERCAEAEAKARFLEEARTAAALNHENIIDVYDFGEHEGRPFIVMEFLRGESLNAAIKQGHTGDLANKLKLAVQIAQALDFIHAHGIIHRDIKPDNVHVNLSGVAKLIDFGIAKVPDSMLKTPDGSVIGTPPYMAPEQIEGKVTRQVDIYAFGLLLYELMTGVRAVTGSTVEEVFYRIMNEPVDLQPLENAGVPRPVIELIERCTAKLPAERPKSFDTVCDELKRAYLAAAPRAEGAVETQPRSWISRRDLPYWIIAFALIAALIWVLATRTPAEKKEGAAVEPSPKVLPTVVQSTAGAMELVKGGSFIFSERPVNLSRPDFYIDRTEVTNEAYGRFCRETGQACPSGRPELPVTNVSFEEAQHFCEWAKKRLPTSEEWEKAARGVDGRVFPWGNGANARNANVLDNQKLREHVLKPADSFPLGMSPFGALNMAGNAREWVDETRNPIPKSIELYGREGKLKPPCTVRDRWYVVRGGSYLFALHGHAETYEWMEVPGCDKEDDIGFRCARNP